MYASQAWISSRTTTLPATATWRMAACLARAPTASSWSMVPTQQGVSSPTFDRWSHPGRSSGWTAPAWQTRTGSPPSHRRMRGSIASAVAPVGRA